MEKANPDIFEHHALGSSTPISEQNNSTANNPNEFGMDDACPIFQQGSSNYNEQKTMDRWAHLSRFTNRPSAFAHPQFEPGKENLEQVQKCPVLVVGAGGLGCEILKDLALSGFCQIHVIDMDTVDVSNLNRQFLFRERDVGKSKSEVAAAFIRTRVPGCNVVPHNCRIQEKSIDFYRQFMIIICGLDSVDARLWLNATVCGLTLLDDDGQPDMSTIVPLIDGGTEGFRGSARVIFPYMTPCIQCTAGLYTPQVNFPLCTIAHTPRLPEHCIEYAKVILWDKEKPFGEDQSLDGDNPKHVEWAFKRAQERAAEFGIVGVDLRLTQGVLKRIVPAVASTNAIIAASCVLEALKLASNISCNIQNYLNFENIDGISFNVVSLERDSDCIACGSSQASVNLDVPPSATLQDLIDRLRENYHLKCPSVRGTDAFLYMVGSGLMGSAELKAQSEQNMKKTLKDLNVCENGELLVDDDNLRKPFTIRVKFLHQE